MHFPSVGYYPGKLQAVGIIQTVIGGLQIFGSILGAIYVLFVGILTMGIGLILIPIPIVYLIVGILSLVSGIKTLNKNPARGLGMGVSIAQLPAILLCDVISFGCGLTALILLSQEDVKAYLR